MKASELLCLMFDGDIVVLKLQIAKDEYTSIFRGQVSQAKRLIGSGILKDYEVLQLFHLPTCNNVFIKEIE